MKRTLTFICALVLLATVLVGCSNNTPTEEPSPTQITLTKSDFKGSNYLDVFSQLDSEGFTNIITVELNDLTSSQKDKDGIVDRVTIGGEDSYKTGSVLLSNVEVKIYYHNIKMVSIPFSSDECPEDALYETVLKDFQEAEFTNIKCEPIRDLTFGWLTKDGEIETILIDGKDTFSKYDSVAFDTEVVIKYHAFPTDSDTNQSTDQSTEIETETTLTAKNCKDLAELLSVKDPASPTVSSFAAKYVGKTIEFDANIAHSSKHGNYDTRYDILLYAGNYNSNSATGPNFQFVDVGLGDLGLSFSENINDYISVGTNIHVVAKVEHYNANSELFILDPISIERR